MKINVDKLINFKHVLQPIGNIAKMPHSTRPTRICYLSKSKIGKSDNDVVHIRVVD